MSDVSITSYATLSYLDSQGLQRTVRINRPVFSIGRLRTNDLQINNSYVSRRHAEIMYQDGEFLLRDNNSTGGVIVNGERITTHVLRSGDQFQLGDVQPVTFLFEIQAISPDSEGVTRTDDEQRTTDRLTTVIASPRSRFLNTALLDSAENITDFTLNRLKALNEFSRKMLAAGSIQSLLECLLDAAMETLPAERLSCCGTPPPVRLKSAPYKAGQGCWMFSRASPLRCSPLSRTSPFGALMPRLTAALKQRRALSSRPFTP